MKYLYLLMKVLLQPANIYLYSSPTSMRSLTDHNKNLLTKVRMSTVVETF